MDLPKNPTAIALTEAFGKAMLVNEEKPVAIRIRLRLLGVFLLVALGIATAGAFFYVREAERLAQRTLDQLSGIDELKVREISLWRNEKLAEARTLERNTFVTRAVREYLAGRGDNHLGNEIQTWMRSFQEGFGYRHVLLLDRKGTVRLSVPDEVPIDPAVLEKALGAPPGSGPLFFDFHRSGGDGALVLSLVTQVPDPDGPGSEPAGFFVLQIDPREFLYPFIQLWPTPSETAETLLVERQGEEVVFLNELRHRKGAALTLRFPVTETKLPATHAVKGHPGTLEGLDYRGEPVFSAFRPVPGSPWALVAKVDRREIQAPLEEETVLLGSLMAALLVASGSILLYIEKGQASRIYRERQTALEERKRLEERERLLAQFEAVLNNILEGVVILDFDGNVLTMNRAALALHDFESNDQVPQHFLGFQEAFELADLDGTVVPIEQWPLSCVLRGEKFTNREIRHRHKKTGKTWIASYNGTLVINWSGEVSLAVVTLRDITERKQREEKIERLNAQLAERVAELGSVNRDLEAFNHTVAHDLRKPLTVISGYSQVVEDQCTGQLDEKCTGYIKEICDGTHRMSQLIDALLNLSTLSQAKLDRKKVDLSAMAKAVAAELKQAEPERQVIFRIADGATVVGDERLFRVALENLLGNSWKYTSVREKAVIEFGMIDINGKPTFFVRDNGIGFAQAEAERLFLPFERLPGTMQFPGFGIGLASVERIIRRHGGRVWAEGEVGKGATFYFTLGQQS